jgi:hypothetical protein
MVITVSGFIALVEKPTITMRNKVARCFILFIDTKGNNIKTVRKDIKNPPAKTGGSQLIEAVNGYRVNQ